MNDRFLAAKCAGGPEIYFLRILSESVWVISFQIQIERKFIFSKSIQSNNRTIVSEYERELKDYDHDYCE